MPRFTLKDLFLAVTLIGGGLVATCHAVTADLERWNLLRFVMAVEAWAAVGAGVLAIFHRKAFGAKIGAVVGFFYTSWFWLSLLWAMSLQAERAMWGLPPK